MSAIFLSAGVPPSADRRGYDTADAYLIREAVSAFIEVVLGRRPIVWGGQPAITPMIWAAAAALNVDYSRTVRLYQSTFFRDAFPEENARFQNLVAVPLVPGNRTASLTRMREEMLSSAQFEAAVFIGGSDGLFEELDIFRRLWPLAKLIAFPAPGGVAAEIYERPYFTKGLEGSIDFSSILYERLAISPSDNRTVGLDL
jgi:hypothetical protein